MPLTKLVQDVSLLYMDSIKYSVQVERCDCGTPLVKRVGSRALAVRKNQNGPSVNMIVKYSGNESSVTCEKCHKTISFLTNKVQKSSTYVMTPQLEKV